MHQRPTSHKTRTNSLKFVDNTPLSTPIARRLRTNVIISLCRKALDSSTGTRLNEH